jgi:hypothetical protein
MASIEEDLDAIPEGSWSPDAWDDPSLLAGAEAPAEPAIDKQRQLLWWFIVKQLAVRRKLKEERTRSQWYHRLYKQEQRLHEETRQDAQKSVEYYQALRDEDRERMSTERRAVEQQLRDARAALGGLEREHRDTLVEKQDVQRALPYAAAATGALGLGLGAGGYALASHLFAPKKSPRSAAKQGRARKASKPRKAGKTPAPKAKRRRAAAPSSKRCGPRGK